MQPPRENAEVWFFEKKNTVECITPHKLAVLCFMCEYIKLRDADLEAFIRPGVTRTGLPSKIIRDFALLTLKLIYGPDLTFSELYALLRSDQYSFIPGHVDNFLRRVTDIIELGLNNFMDLYEFWLTKVQRVCARKEFLVFRSSVAGFYIRRFCMSVEKMEFSELICVIEHFKAYCEKDFNATVDESGGDICSMELTNIEDNSEFTSPIQSSPKGQQIPNHMLYDIESIRCSRRQAELFIARQATLLKINDNEALPPPILQDKIQSLLKTNPGFSEAHFLCYLNCLRVKEFCGAVDSLYHAFDRNTSMADGKPGASTEEKGDAFRYAALNLAILHTQFGHKEEALAALKEAVNQAQKANDSFCLQHALTWMYKLTDTNKELLIERSILKSNELNLYYNTSLGIQAYGQHMGLNGGKPKYIFDLLTKSDVINCQHSVIELLSNSYIQKAALWNFYGKPDLGLSWSQALLYIKLDHKNREPSYNGEGICNAICNISISFTEEGEYEKAYIVLHNARERFPNEPISHIWKRCEQYSYYKQAYFNELWEQAEMRARQIATFDPWQSHLYLAEIFLAKQNYESSLFHANTVLNYTQTSGESSTQTLASNRIYLKIQALILLAEIKCAQFSSGNISAEAVKILNEAYDIAEKYYLKYYANIILCYLAHVHLWIKLPLLAMKLINKALINVFGNGSLFDRSRALVLYIKCYLANLNITEKPGDVEPSKFSDIMNKQIHRCVDLLDKAKQGYEKLEAYSRLKDVVYLQAKLYDSANRIVERNKCAAEFKLLLEKYPDCEERKLLLTAF